MAGNVGQGVRRRRASSEGFLDRAALERLAEAYNPA